MFSIGKISQEISNKITLELNLEKDKKDVINYGIFALIQIIASIILVIIFGGVFNATIESLIVSFVISILRKSSGGVHASSPGVCMIIGTFASVGMAKISLNINLNLNLIFFSGIIIFVTSFYLLYKLAPVDSISKPIKKIEKRKKLKKNSIIILTIYLFVVIINIITFNVSRNYKSLIYISCIYLGVIWQIFSLTKIGHITLGKVDKLISLSLSCMERRCKI